jgi:hypothetical protein
MNLSETLKQYADAERSSLIAAYFTKPIWNNDYFEITLNRLPESVLIEWVSAFLEYLIKGEKDQIPFSFSGNTSIGRTLWPLDFEVTETSIEVSAVTTSKGTSKVQSFMFIDGPKASIAIFKKRLIDDNTEKLGLYSYRKGRYKTRQIEEEDQEETES